MILSLTVAGWTLALTCGRDEPDPEPEPGVFESHLGGSFDPAPVDYAEEAAAFGYQATRKER